MKSIPGIILGIFIGLLVFVLIIVLLIYVYFIPASRDFSSVETSAQVSGYSIPIPTTSFLFTPEPSQATSTIPSTPTTHTTTASGSLTPNDVEFSLNITEISGNSLSPTISAEITNTGSIDAQNTIARIEVFSNGKRIKIGGEEFFEKELGTLQAGVPVAARVTLNFNPVDAAVILASGARLDLTIVSDQKTRIFSYHYEP